MGGSTRQPSSKDPRAHDLGTSPRAPVPPAVDAVTAFEYVNEGVLHLLGLLAVPCELLAVPSEQVVPVSIGSERDSQGG
jgi:hypothetical protein